MYSQEPRDCRFRSFPTGVSPQLRSSSAHSLSRTCRLNAPSLSATTCFHPTAYLGNVIHVVPVRVLVSNALGTAQKPLLEVLRSPVHRLQVAPTQGLVLRKLALWRGALSTEERLWQDVYRRFATQLVHARKLCM
jgi:hypothetical protein